jgi:hypothetical protein
MSETMDQGGASLGDEDIETTPSGTASETVEGDTDTTDTGGGGGGDSDSDDADADMDDADS